MNWIELWCDKAENHIICNLDLVESIQQCEGIDGTYAIIMQLNEGKILTTSNKKEDHLEKCKRVRKALSLEN